MLSFERFPFFVGPRPVDSAENDIPAYLPFHLEVDPALALPRLRITDAIRNSLAHAYAHGSMLSTPLGRGNLGAARMAEMVAHLTEAFGRDPAGARFLEIGCGCGDLLNAFKQLGAEVHGCEIGPQAEIARHEFGIPVTREPLEHAKFDEPFDCVYSYGLIEHIEDLAGFFAAARRLLRPGGLFFHSCPNTENTAANLRIEDLCHEHVNYFTPTNAKRLLTSQGFASVNVIPTTAGNEIRLSGVYDPALPIMPPNQSREAAMETETMWFNGFAGRLTHRLSRWHASIDEAIDKGRSVGFYAGGYVIAALHRKANAIRYYDGDSLKHGLVWLPGLDPIRAPETLRDDPVDVLVICAEHYFDAIHARLINDIRVGENMRIIPLSEF